MTANNLIEFFNVLPAEEQYKFMQLAEKSLEPKKLRFPKKKSETLTQKEAIQYLITNHFK
ncbi:hypothetical protein [Flavobacterium sp.]|uniref:hypothetical protein n=1 Tax=Flavobacterium sp. TaxID=239 RepID=UPI000EE347D3|nr:hypothetical protein [Flavobacterium sp.]HCQ12056.1 hypothetical protein [Flavobacterium sp.]